MSSYSSTLRYLYGLQGRGMKFGLHNTKALLSHLGNPERSFPSVHIAGTNGKGSTAAFTASILKESGYRTGLYTSPHLVNFTERIRINGIPIPEETLVDYVRKLRPHIDRSNGTFFEATTCIAFQYFAEMKIDVAVVETGLGGRLDSTNVLRPLVSVITNVSLDHMEYLGSTIKKIAREKGGIIKRRVPCVTGSTEKAVLEVLQRIATRKETNVLRTKDIVNIHSAVPWRGGVSLRFSTKKQKGLQCHLGLPGAHQIGNACLAVAALQLVTGKEMGNHRILSISGEAFRLGLQKVKQNTGIRGRLEYLGKNHRYLVDVAHNQEGVSTLVGSLQRKKGKKIVVLFGAMQDKAYKEMLDALSVVAKLIIAVSLKNERALRSSAIAEYLSARGVSYSVAGSVADGLRLADQLTSGKETILITGSHYLVGEAMELIEGKS